MFQFITSNWRVSHSDGIFMEANLGSFLFREGDRFPRTIIIFGFKRIVNMSEKSLTEQIHTDFTGSNTSSPKKCIML